MDPRTRRTLVRLEDALSTLLRTHSLGEVTVSELCRTAQIHRTTFYKHFSPAGEFVTWGFSGRIDSLSLGGREDLPTAVPELVGAYENALRGMLEHVAANRDIYRRLCAPDGDFTFQRMLTDLLSGRALEAHRRFVERGRPVPVDEETAARIVGAVCAAGLVVWATQDGTDAAARTREISSALPPWWQHH